MDGFFLPEADDTTRLGVAIAAVLKAGDAVCLFGPLGAGKSTLARGLVRALTSPDEEVPSPTFTLVQMYVGEAFPIYHFDLYRLKGATEVFELGLDEALDTGAAIIEWPERLEGDLPADRLEVRLLQDGEGRRAALQRFGAWADRVLEFGERS